MVGFSVDTSAVKGHAGNLQDALTDFGKNADTFDTAMNDLLNGPVKDGAEGPLRDLHQQWMDAGEEVKKGLDQLGLRTDEIAKAFDEGKQQQADNVRARGNAMNFHVEQA